MESNVIVFGWNRSIPGREKISAQHFQEYVQYLTALQQAGAIQSFEAVFLNPHGGDFNGFFLIHGEGAKLGDLVKSDDWFRHMTRAMLHLEGAGYVFGATGAAVMDRMKLWTELLPA